MKRYSIELSLFVYAKNDKEAVEKSKQLPRLIDNCGDLCCTNLEDNDFLREQNDNKCSVVSINETPFGSLDSRKVKI